MNLFEKQYRLVLIGCSSTKTKDEGTRKNGFRFAIRDLYAGPLFNARRNYVETRDLDWLVLSAKYGAIAPQIEVKKYDEDLRKTSKADFAIWHSSVCFHVTQRLYELFDEEGGPVLTPSQMVVEMHAGELYCEPLAKMLEALGISVERPLKGMSIGRQLKWYADQKAWVEA